MNSLYKSSHVFILHFSLAQLSMSFCLRGFLIYKILTVHFLYSDILPDAAHSGDTSLLVRMSSVPVELLGRPCGPLCVSPLLSTVQHRGVNPRDAKLLLSHSLFCYSSPCKCIVIVYVCALCVVRGVCHSAPMWKSESSSVELVVLLLYNPVGSRDLTASYLASSASPSILLFSISH